MNYSSINDKIDFNFISSNFWLSLLLSFIAGTLLPLAFAPFSYGLIAVLSLAILGFLLISQKSHPFKLGFLFGLGYFGVGISWVFVPMYYYGNMSMPLAVLATFLWVSFFALFPATTAFVAQKITKKLNINDYYFLSLILPTVWLFFEWLRIWFLTGFPWLMVGTSQLTTPFGGLLPIVGELGVGFVVVLFAGLLVITITRPIKIYSISLMIFIWLNLSFISSIQWTKPTGETIKIALVRGNITAGDKWMSHKVTEIFDYYSETTQKITNADLIVWSESAVPTLYRNIKKRLQDLKKSLPSSDLMIGTIMKNKNSNYHTTLAHLNNDNQDTFYHKRHLVPFGEYTPLANSVVGWLMNSLQIPMSNLVPGNNSDTIIKVKNTNIAPSICYEVIFSDLIRKDAGRANILLTVSDDSWFNQSLSSEQHLEIAQVRAKENGKPMVRATNTGVTAIIKSDGTIQSRLSSDEIPVLVGNVATFKGQTFYNKYGNHPIFIFLLIIFLGLFYAKRKH